MKKILSFVLVLAMILGCTSMAFATTANETLKKSTDYVTPFADAEANAVATILKDLGILDGTGTGKVELDNAIDRASFCKILLVALGLADSVEKTETKFTDVPKEHWASGYIALANSLGYVDGTSATTFNPSGKVTANEAVAFVLKALGYQQKYLLGEWPQNYLTIANELQILGKNYAGTGLESMNLKAGTQEVTREYAFTLLTRALNQDCVKWREATIALPGAWVTVTQAIGGGTTTLLGKVLGTYDNKTLGSLYGKVEVASLTAEDAAKFENFADAKNYIGQKVTVLTMNSGKWVGLAKVTNNKVEGKFADDTLVTFTAIDGTVYKTTAPAVNAALQIFNGGQVASNTDVITSGQAYTLTVEFDGKDASKIQTVSAIAWEKISETRVVTATEAAYLAADKYASYNALHSGAQIYTTNKGVDLIDGFLTVEGAATKLADIQKGDVVEIYAATQAGTDAGYNNKIAKIVVVRNVVTGKVTNYDSLNKKYTVNGTAYSFMKGVTAGSDIQKVTTSEYAFTLNSAGKIATYKLAGEEEVVETPWNYAFVVQTGYTAAKGATELDAEATATTYSIRLANFDGEEVVFTGLKAKVLGASVAGSANWVVTAGDKVMYQLNGDAVTTMKAVTTEFVSAPAIAKIDAQGVNGKLFASDVKVIKYNTAGGNTVTKVAFYAPKTVADVEGKYNAAGQVEYHVNSKSNKIDLLVVSGSAAGASDLTTFAAVLVGKGVDATGTYASFLVAGEVKTVYNDKTLATMTDLATSAVAFVTLKDGKLVDNASAPAINTAAYGAYVATKKGLALKDGIVTVNATGSGATGYSSNLTTEFAIKNASVIKWNGKTYEKAAEADIEKAAKNVLFLDIDGDKFVELVVIDYEGATFTFNPSNAR